MVRRAVRRPVLDERFTWRKGAGLAIGVVGVALVRFGPMEVNANVILGSLACIAANICYAMGGTYMKKRAYGVPAFGMTSASLLIATVACCRRCPARCRCRRCSTGSRGGRAGHRAAGQRDGYVLYFRLLVDVAHQVAHREFSDPGVAVLWARYSSANRRRLHGVRRCPDSARHAMVLELGHRPARRSAVQSRSEP